jgi:hypothetical protein
MGAGKSAVAAFLTDQLRRSGIAARFMPEGPTIDEPDHTLRVATELPHPNAAWRDVQESSRFSTGSVKSTRARDAR